MYGRDYDNRNFLDRAANTVRGWMGHRGGHGYDDGFRGGMRGSWDDGRGHREMNDAGGGYRGWNAGMEHGYGGTHWAAREPGWNRGLGHGTVGGVGGGWDRGGDEGYRTGGYNPSHGAWDVDWDDGDRTLPRGRNGMAGRPSAGMMGGGADRYDRGYAGRGFRDDEPGLRGMRGGAMNRGMQGGMGRGGMTRGYDRDMDRNRPGGMYGTGMPGRDADVGDASGGMIGNYGPYGSYGLERFRSGSAGGVPTGQYWTGYGHGSGYRG